jgi:serine/threonine protein kinase
MPVGRARRRSPQLVLPADHRRTASAEYSGAPLTLVDLLRIPRILAATTRGMDLVDLYSLSRTSRTVFRETELLVRAFRARANKLPEFGRLGPSLLTPAGMRGELTGHIEGVVLLQSSLPDFVKLASLGSGSYAKVFLVRHRETKRYYALKECSKEDAVHNRRPGRLYWEKDVASKVARHSPFCVRLWRTFQDSKNVYFLFEFCPGGELFHHLVKRTSFDELTARFYSAQIVLFLLHMSRCNVLYRDLKPENIMLDRDGNARVCDFGFASCLGVGERASSFLASAEYISPEMLRGNGYDGRADVWGLGILMYEMVCGRTPWRGNLEQVSAGVQSGQLAWPRHVGSPSFRDLVSSLLQVDPDKRPSLPQVMQHPWFGGLSWRGIAERTVPAPLRPPVLHDGDVQNFPSAEPITEPAERTFSEPQSGDGIDFEEF